MLADVKDETLGARLSDVRAKALVTVMADTIADVQNETNGNTLGNVDAEALVYTLAGIQ